MTTIYISDRLIRALCNTLIHSLWQGILLAIIAGLIVICTRKASSTLRYNLLVSALLLFAVGVSVTFAVNITPPQDAAHVAQSSLNINYSVAAATSAATQIAASPALPAATPKPAFTDRISSYLNDHHNTIVLVWFLIICARSLQLGVGLYGTYRLKRVRVSAVKDHWPERMQQLAAALGVGQTIALLESGLAKAPVMIGYLKPVILMPVGLLTALSTNEVEAILIHELAHIKRRDYLVNILQNLAEIVFFFNPAVLWVSALIRTERENCCDDLALAHDNNKSNYIRALVSCEEYKASAPPFAMAFPGATNTLLHRVKRLANNRNHSLNLFEKTVLTICLVALGLGVSAFTARKDVKKVVKSVVPALHLEAKADHKSNEGRVPNGLQIRGQIHHLVSPIPSDTVPAPPSDTIPVPPSIIIEDFGDTLIKYGVIQDKRHIHATFNNYELVINGVKQPDDVFQLLLKKYHSKYGDNLNITYTNNGLPDKRMEQNTFWAGELRKIIDEMQQDGLINNGEDLSFLLTAKQFRINGVMQREEVLQKYRQAYVPSNAGDDWNWTYSHHK